MKTATITEAKNGLSALIDRVKAGESVIITDRGVPVAVLEPAPGRVDLEDRLASLERRGLIRRGAGGPALAEILRRRPVPTPGTDALALVREDRDARW